MYCDMEDSVNKLIDSLIEQAKTEARKLAEQLEAKGQIALPQPLAEGAWSNSKGEEFDVIIMLNQSQSTIGRQMGMTSLQLYTIYDEKFVMDYYMRHNQNLSRCEMNRIAEGCTGVKRGTGQHPGGIVVLPRGEEIYSFFTVQHEQKMRSALLCAFPYTIPNKLQKLHRVNDYCADQRPDVL